MTSRLAWLPCAALIGCAAPGLAPPPVTGAAASPEDANDARVPAAEQYVAVPRPKGVVGGAEAEELARALTAALRERGDVAEPDGALADAAAWFLNETAAGHPPDAIAAEATARRLGFVGTLVITTAFDLGHPTGAGWREALAAIPRNLPINRFGVRVSPGPRLAGIAFGAVEATLQPFPRHVAAGATVRLQGEVGPRFSAAHVHVTRPDGNVTRIAGRGRTFDTVLALPSPGVYQVEVMGDGATGPVIVVNVPVYVGWGVPERAATAAPTVFVSDPPKVEERLLTLLNQARGRAGLTALLADAELRALALGHDEDMVRGRFFGHVSPTTGTLDDRARRAQLYASVIGENLAQAPDADNAHRQLMDSPAHRANMLNPRFTHVGIAVLPDPASGNLAATLVFARRPPPVTGRPAPREAHQRAHAARARKSLAPIHVDPVLQQAAEAGAAALEGGASPTAALGATEAVLQSGARRRSAARRQLCTQLAQLFEHDDVQERTFLSLPALAELGMAFAVLGEPTARRLWLLSVYAAPSCR